MEGQLEDEMKGSAEFKKDDPHVDPTDLRKLFAQFSKEKKLTFNKKDEDKYGIKNYNVFLCVNPEKLVINILLIL